MLGVCSDSLLFMKALLLSKNLLLMLIKVYATLILRLLYIIMFSSSNMHAFTCSSLHHISSYLSAWEVLWILYVHAIGYAIKIFKGP